MDVGVSVCYIHVVLGLGVWAGRGKGRGGLTGFGRIHVADSYTRGARSRRSCGLWGRRGRWERGGGELMLCYTICGCMLYDDSVIQDTHDKNNILQLLTVHRVWDVCSSQYTATRFPLTKIWITTSININSIPAPMPPPTSIQKAIITSTFHKEKYTPAVRSKILSNSYLCMLCDTPIARIAGCVSSLV